MCKSLFSHFPLVGVGALRYATHFCRVSFARREDRGATPTGGCLSVCLSVCLMSRPQPSGVEFPPFSSAAEPGLTSREKGADEKGADEGH